MGLLRKYNRHLIKRGYNGPISFHAPFKLGQIITFSRRHGFTPIGNIGDKYFGIENYKPKIIKGKSVADIDFGTETGVNIQSKLKGNAPLSGSKLTIADAGFRISFENEASFLLLTKNTNINIIENTAELGSIIIKLYKEGSWNRNWMVITQMVNAQTTTLLIAQKSGAYYEIKADGNINGLKDELVNGNINFSLAASNGMYTSIIGQKGPFFPLFKLRGICIRRLRPVGSEFLSIDSINPMSAFTINKLKQNDSEFDIDFEESTFTDEIEVDDDGLI
jgi:hypothetical protein